MFDITIIGAGPAGITVAVYAARKKLKTLVVTKNIGGQASWSGDIENYPGFQFIPGSELAKKLDEHLKRFAIDIKENTEVTGIEQIEGGFLVKSSSASYETKTVVITTGRKPRLLGIPGEREFKGKGVTYCATCDGPVFTGKDVVVIGGGNSALDAILQLMKMCRKVYAVSSGPELKGDEVMKEKVALASNVEVILNAATRAIIGGPFVTGVKLLINKTEERMIPVEGVIIEIGSIPVSSPGMGVELNENNEIVVNERCETSVPGIFAAGDCTNVPEKQIIVAAGQGCIASLSASKYVARMRLEQNAPS